MNGCRSEFAMGEARELLLKFSKRKAEIAISLGSNTLVIEHEFQGRGFRNISPCSGAGRRFEDILHGS
jgi:hypothetical protein